MAGQLTIDTLKASSGVLATQNGMTGIAKAWVCYDGVGGSILGSFNVGSVTKNSTGNYTVNFTTAMANSNYCVSGTTIGSSTLTGSGFTTNLSSTNTADNIKSTTQVRFLVTRNNDSALVDVNSISISVDAS